MFPFVIPWIATFAALAAATPVPAPRVSGLPPIVFVSRHAAPDPALVPGLGPAGRALAPGGTLMMRERDGRVRALLAPGALWDVSDPSVSFTADSVAFAGVASAEAPWRLWIVALDGGGLRPLTFDDARAAMRSDDLDPCWIGARTLVFASTRYPQRAQYADVPVTNLWRLDLDRAAPRRLTSERNGAEEPAWDAESGRVVFARWWFNRWRAATPATRAAADAGAPDAAGTGARADAGAGAGAPPGLIAVAPGTHAADAIDLWQVMSITPDGRDERVEAGDPARRRDAMGYQPAPLPGGAIAAVFARNAGLEPSPGALGLHVLPPGFGAARRIAGVSLAQSDSTAYGSTRGLAAPAACSPAALPDGRIVFAFDPTGRGDFGLAVADVDGTRRTAVLDLLGTLELDPAPVVRRAPRVLPPPPASRRDAPAATLAALERGGTFRYANADVFAGAGAPRIDGARLRFFAALARASAGGDTAVLVREVAVPRGGRVDERGLPADVPMFEQLIDAHGAVLRTPAGPAHVAGLNVTSPNGTARCTGCHLGHSIRGR